MLKDYTVALWETDENGKLSEPNGDARITRRHCLCANTEEIQAEAVKMIEGWGCLHDFEVIGEWDIFQSEPLECGLPCIDKKDGKHYSLQIYDSEDTVDPRKPYWSVCIMDNDMEELAHTRISADAHGHSDIARKGIKWGNDWLVNNIESVHTPILKLTEVTRSSVSDDDGWDGETFDCASSLDDGRYVILSMTIDTTHPAIKNARRTGEAIHKQRSELNKQLMVATRKRDEALRTAEHAKAEIEIINRLLETLK